MCVCVFCRNASRYGSPYGSSYDGAHDASTFDGRSTWTQVKTAKRREMGERLSMCYCVLRDCFISCWCFKLESCFSLILLLLFVCILFLFFFRVLKVVHVCEMVCNKQVNMQHFLMKLALCTFNSLTQQDE